MNKNKISTLLFSSLFLSMSVNASIVAVVDSGVDVDHEDLVDRIAINNGELNKVQNVDDDDNGFVDDIYGWNFVSNNNVVYDANYKKNYDNNFYIYSKYDYFNFLSDYTNVRISFSNFAYFIKNVLYKNGEFNSEFALKDAEYGTYSHGTHVSGIIARHAGNSILPIKAIGSGVDLDDEEDEEPLFVPTCKEDLTQLKNIITEDAVEGVAEDEKSFAYAAHRGARVVNGSFGTSFKDTKDMLDFLYSDEDKEAMSPFISIDDIAKMQIDELNRVGANALKKFPNILFVFSASNDGDNNDELPEYPANIDSDNVISVGATFQDKFVAYFSNYGQKNVDVFAPGVGILSSVPGGHLYMNGTSQSAPQVSRIAGHVLDVNGDLSTHDLKTIIMKTVDKKDFLLDQCVSGGIVNEDRAVYAAQIMKENNLSVDDAIAIAKDEINDVVYEQYLKSTAEMKKLNAEHKLKVTPLPSTFLPGRH